MISNLSLILALICLVAYLFLSLKKKQKIAESEAYYRSLFENQAQAVIIEEEDTTLSLVNKKFEELSGYSKVEVEGKMKSADFHPPEEKERILNYHRARMDKNLPPPPSLYEAKFLTRDGKIKYVQVYADLIPETKKTIAILSDITQAKKAQEELQTMRDYLNKLITYTNSPILVVDPEMRIVLFNQASERISGYKAEEVIGKNINILSGGKIKESDQLRKRILRGENLRLIESPMVTKKGEVRTILWNSACIFDDEGKLEGVIFQGQDITEIKKAREELQRAYELNLRALTTALEAREHGTERHCKRVARYATVLAHRMGVDKDYIKDIRYGALLHDIGKIGISDSLLLKPGRLTPEEMEEIKKHPLIGANILKGIDYFTRAIEIVLYHHERWDGTGYPVGLTGDKIPLSARIFAVVDAFDAMTTHRPYRKKMSMEAALKEIKKAAGTQFDPQVVKAFLSISPGILRSIRKN